MRERGWVEGGNIVFERCYWHGDRTRLSGFMTELVALHVDVIFVQGALAVMAAKQATDRIPIVFAVGDAIGRDVVANVARPEGNVTGVSNRFREVMGKRVELLMQVSPGISRVVALMNTTLGYPPTLFHEPELRAVEIFIVDLRNTEEIASACASVSKLQADAILVAQGLNYESRSDLVDAITKLRLPAVFPGRSYVEMGGLLSFGNDFNLNFRRIAAQIDKLLRGSKPVDLPVEQPTVFELAINLKTARDLGIAIPRELLVRADWIVA